MKKFRLKRFGKEIHGFYLNIQIVPHIIMEREDLEYKLRQDNEMVLVYCDEGNCIWEETIHAGDEIEFL